MRGRGRGGGLVGTVLEMEGDDGGTAMRMCGMPRDLKMVRTTNFTDVSSQLKERAPLPKCIVRCRRLAKLRSLQEGRSCTWLCQLLFSSVVSSICVIEKLPDSGDCCPASRPSPAQVLELSKLGRTPGSSSNDLTFPVCRPVPQTRQSHPAPSGSGPADSAPHVGERGGPGPEKGVRVPTPNSSEARASRLFQEALPLCSRGSYTRSQNCF